MSTFPWHLVNVLAIPTFPVVVWVSSTLFEVPVYVAFIMGAGWMVALTDTIRHYGGTR